jgi:hypothetical protein
MEFDELKDETLRRTHHKDACIREYKRAAAAKDADELLEVIKANIGWALTSRMLTAEDIERLFGEALCNAHDIYFRNHQTLRDKASVHFGSSTSEHYGSSTSEHYDSSTSVHFDSSTSKHYGSSTSKHYDSSTSVHFDSSTSYCTSAMTAHKLFEQAILRDIHTNILYIRKDAINIIFQEEVE